MEIRQPTAWEILDSPKDGYTVTGEVDQRTLQALGGDERLLVQDGTETGEFVREVLAVLAAALEDMPAGYTVLDAGCGYGRFAPFFADCGGYLGIDLSKERIGYANAHYRMNEKFDFLAADFLAADILDCNALAPNDFILCAKVVQHLPIAKKRDLLQFLVAQLAPAGVLLVWDDAISDMTIKRCAQLYAEASAPHMIPMPLELAAQMLKPLSVRVHKCPIGYVLEARRK